MVNLLRSLGEHVLLALACVVLLAGVLWFEFYPQSAWLGYALVLPSAALLVLLPQFIRFSEVAKSEWVLGLFVSLAVVSALAFATAWQVVSVPRQEMRVHPLIPLWFPGIAVSLFSAFCFDYRSSTLTSSRPSITCSLTDSSSFRYRYMISLGTSSGRMLRS